MPILAIEAADIENKWTSLSRPEATSTSYGENLARVIPFTIQYDIFVRLEVE